MSSQQQQKQGEEEGDDDQYLTYLRRDPTLGTLEEHLIVQCIELYAAEKSLDPSIQREVQAIYLHRFSISSFFQGKAMVKCRELWDKLIVPDSILMNVRDGFRGLLREMSPALTADVPIRPDHIKEERIVANPAFGSLEESLIVRCIRGASGEDEEFTPYSVALFLHRLSKSSFYNQAMTEKCKDMWITVVVSDREMNKSDIQEKFKQLLRAMKP